MHCTEILFTPRCSLRATEFQWSGVDLFYTTYGCGATGRQNCPIFRFLPIFQYKTPKTTSTFRWPAYSSEWLHRRMITIFSCCSRRSKGTRAPWDSSQPPFCPKWADRSQNSLNVVTPWPVCVLNLVQIGCALTDVLRKDWFFGPKSKYNIGSQPTKMLISQTTSRQSIATIRVRLLRVVVVSIFNRYNMRPKQ